MTRFKKIDMALDLLRESLAEVEKERKKTDEERKVTETMRDFFASVGKDEEAALKNDSVWFTYNELIELETIESHLRNAIEWTEYAADIY